MTVAELIEELKKMPPDLKVSYIDDSVSTPLEVVGVRLQQNCDIWDCLNNKYRNIGDVVDLWGSNTL